MKTIENIVGFLGKRVAPFILLAGLAGCPPPTTPTPTPTPEEVTITKGADRLLSLQNANGSWDWDVTNATGPTSTTYYNITGITAEGLLDAYNVTKDAKYLDAAKKAGNYIVSTPISTTQKQNAFTVGFLYNLNSVTGDSQYKTKADAIMNSILYQNNYWEQTGTGSDTAVGCSATELATADATWRSGMSYTNPTRPITNPNGIVLWDMYKYPKDAKRFGDTSSFANDLAILGKNYIEGPGYTTIADYNALGLSAAVMGLKDAGVDYSSELSRLLAKQNSDGTFYADPVNEGVTQTTSYAVMALVKAGDKINAKRGVDAGMNHQSANGGWVESDGVEYSEVDSEAIQAITDYISK